MTRLFVGYDIAQASDWSAISVIESAIVPPYYRLRHLERLPRRTPYPEQVKHVVELCDQIGKRFGALPLLACDFSGVGAPVFDMLRVAYQGTTKGILITGGSQVTISEDGRVHRIPKLSLISRLRVTMESGKLKIARSMPETDAFIDELGKFELKIDEKGHVTMQAAGSGHDDLVLSVSIAIWMAHERGGHYGSSNFVNPIIRSARPENLHRAIPTSMTRRPPKYPQLR